jgi:glycosyltransferase involved in cell wall biosynthesis
MTQPRRYLALFLSGLAGGGAQRRMVTLANAFAARGHRVDLVPASSAGGFGANLSDSVRLVGLDPRWTRLPGLVALKGPRVLASAPALAAYLRRERPDALLSSSNPANAAALMARRLAGTAIPVVVSVNVPVSLATAEGAGRKRTWMGALARRLYPSADGLVANTEGVADDLARWAGLPRERVETIHNPVEAEAIRARARAPLDHPWFAAEAAPVLLGVGKLKRQKDFATLLRAFAHVRKERAARLLLLGEGELRPKLLALARELGVEADVQLPGFVENPAAYMTRASVFVLSSAWEGFSNALIEALACGCPVVSTDCPSGPAQILQQGALGPLVPVGNDVAMARAILGVLDSPPDPEPLRMRADDFSVDRAAERYLEVLEAARARRAAVGAVSVRHAGRAAGS